MKSRLFIVAAITALATITASCGDDDTTETTAATTTTAGATTTVATTIVVYCRRHDRSVELPVHSRRGDDCGR